jgi:hypothetical protein
MTESIAGRPSQEPLLHKLPKLGKDVSSPLFSRIASLNVETENKDKVVLWWQDYDRVEKLLEDLGGVIEQGSLPNNERRHAKKLYTEALRSARGINTGILRFVDSEPSRLQKLARLYTGSLITSKDGIAVNSAAELIDGFEERRESIELANALCRVIIETRGFNPDENLIRKKVAQSVFDEMFTQLGYDRIDHLHDIDRGENPIIDSPKTEAVDLRSTLSATAWTGEEREKALRKYEKLKKVMDKLGTDMEYKVAMNTLWDWANGQIPKNGSVFTIMHYAEYLYDGVTDTLVDAWDMELDKE